MPESAGSPQPIRRCSTCGAAIPAFAPAGQCPRCLLSLASSVGLVEDAPEAEPLLAGEQVRDFGDFELLEEIARGGMGVVYRAWQRSEQREVAVKTILAGQLATSTAVARFRNEALAAAKLNHPHIVPVYEIGEYETQHFFAMKFVPGRRNIAEWARELPEAAREQAIALAMSEVARAIAFAHDRGVLHRDLKPSNILIDENDEPQITDFGLAKVLDETSPVLTLSTMVLGSPSYMAPEQAEPHGRKVTPATDVYGLGAILYELLAGQPPFTGPSPLLVARRVLEEFPPRLLGVTPNLAAICMKCLEKEPGARYPTALALAADLERFARGEPVEAQLASTLSQLRTWARRRPAVAALLGLLALALVGGLAAVAWQWRKTESARRALAGANRELRATIAHLEWRALDTLIERDHAPRAVIELSAQLRENPWNWQAATYAISVVEQRPFAVPAGPPKLVEEEWLATPPALNADSGRAAFASADGRVRLLDTSRGVEMCPEVTAKGVVALAFSPAGEWLAIGEKSGTVLLCELPSGRVVSRTTTPVAPLRALVFSADGTTLALAGGDLLATGAVTEFAAGLTPLRVLSAPFQPSSLRCSADGRTLLAWSQGRDSRLGVWGPPGEGAPIFPEDAVSVRDAAIDGSGTRFVFLARSLIAGVWDVQRRSPVSGTESLPKNPLRVALTPDGQRMLVGDGTGQTRVFSTDTGLPTGLPMQQHYETTVIALNASGTRMLSGDMDFTARLWDVASGEALSQPVMHEGRVTAGVLSGDARTALTLSLIPGSKRQILRSWHFPAAVRPREFPVPGGRNLDGSRLSPDESLIAVGSYLPRNTVSIFETATGRTLLDRLPLEGSVYGCEFTPDGRALVVMTNAGWLYGWNVPGPGQDRTVWQPLWPPVQTPSRLQPCAMAPDGSLVALGGVDGTLRIHSVKTGQPVREMHHGSLIKGVRFRPDGARVATAGRDGLVHVWNVATGEKVTTLTGHTADVLSAQFSPDGMRIVTASYDSTARVWNAETGEPVTPALQHAGELSLARFSVDGKLIGTASRDGTARIWSATTGAPIFEPISRPTTMQQVLFLPDGRRFLTLDLAQFRLCDLSTGEPVSVPFPFPANAGLGLDGPSFQDIISPRGDHLAASNALDAAVYWPLLDPPAPVPAWFPEFLDDLATSGLGPAGAKEASPRDRLTGWTRRAAEFHDSDGYYERWLRRYLGVSRASAGAQ